MSPATRPVEGGVIRVPRQLGRFPVQRVARELDDAEQPVEAFPRALLRQAERRALKIGVDERHSPALQRPFAGEMQRRRRLADATLLVEQGDGHCSPPALRLNGSRGWPPARLSADRAGQQQKLDSLLEC